MPFYQLTMKNNLKKQDKSENQNPKTYLKNRINE